MKQETGACQVVRSGHAGRINGVAASPRDHFAATAGADCTVRCWDYVDRKQLYSAKFETPATCVTWAPLSVDAAGRSIAVGYADGVMRVLLRAAGEWKRLHVFKPHNARITAIDYSPDGGSLATGGEDNIVFLLTVARDDGTPDGSDYIPVGFVRLPGRVNSLNWRGDSRAVLVGCGDGSVVEVPMPSGGAPPSESTFELTSLQTRSWRMEPPRRPLAPVAAAASPKKTERSGSVSGAAAEAAEGGAAAAAAAPSAPPVEEEETDPGAVSCAIYTPSTPAFQEGSFLVCVTGAGRDLVHECEFGSGRPLSVFASTTKPSSLLSLSVSRAFLLDASTDGAVVLRSAQDPLA